MAIQNLPESYPIGNHYSYPKKPFSSDQHIMFVNAVEDYGLRDFERPNWINFVRKPIDRIVSLYYFHKCHPEGRPIGRAFKKTQEYIESNLLRPKRYIKKSPCSDFDSCIKVDVCLGFFLTIRVAKF